MLLLPFSLSVSSSLCDLGVRTVSPWDINVQFYYPFTTYDAFSLHALTPTALSLSPTCNCDPYQLSLSCNIHSSIYTSINNNQLPVLQSRQQQKKNGGGWFINKEWEWEGENKVEREAEKGYHHQNLPWPQETRWLPPLSPCWYQRSPPWTR